jgi:PPOX class probable FMN-dependent enzyme
VTDARSEKISQIEHQSWGEVCWYFPKTQEQFRLAGELTFVGDDCPDPALSRARLLAWQALSDKARSQFTWPHPGQARTAEEDAFSRHAPNPEQPPSNFCLLFLEPTTVDHLELRGEPQNRWLYQRNCDRNWSKQAVNP